MAVETKTKPTSRQEILERLQDKENLGGADFSGLDLSEIKLTGLAMPGANFSRANLHKAVIAGIDLQKADFSDANMEGALIAGANMMQANLQGANLKGAKINGTNLQDADLSGADLSETTFVAVNVSGGNFRDAVTVDARSSAVGWKSAKVPPSQTPKALRPPLWAIGLLVGVVVGIAFVLLRKKKAA
ncbi:MAG: pentapeptide repeat-containing protein [Ardenticatenaceae bacterium]|nr:pentapeptide repeat-containing protein [Ardenticatenaceae bacterium]MCB8987751.1 pentapeptide repeat-containing protein [Ardenticatenaceae bacterium]MCB9140621.1 pentapeptide repeat-containing protein [Caldilineaceae bacterium]